MLKDQAFEKAIHCHGYSYLFSKRASRLSSRLNWLKYFGLVLPALVGLSYSGFGDIPLTKWIDTFTIAASIAVFVISTLAFAFKWDDELSYAFEASQCYDSLSDKFKALHQSKNLSDAELELQYNVLNAEYKARNGQDLKHEVMDHEKRMGMRWGLRQFQHRCKGCDTIPLSMESTDCHVCGNFKKPKRLLQWIKI